MPDRQQAQRRADQIRAFRAELDALAAAGVPALTPEERRRVDRHHDELIGTLAAAYDIDQSEAGGQLSRGMQLTAFFAAAALTAALYSLVSRFWGRLDLPMQATFLCLFPLAALIGVELAARRERSLYVAGLFAIVAYGAFWQAVGVLSLLVDMPVTPAALWAGVLFGLGLALPYGFRLILAAALVTLMAAISGSVFQAAGVPWTAIAEHPEITMCSAFAVMVLAPSLSQLHQAFGTVVRVTGLSVGMTGLLLLGSFGRLSIVPVSNQVIEGVYQGITLVTLVVVLALAVRRRWRETVSLAAVALTLFLLLRFVDWFWEALPRYVFFLLLAGVAFGWLLVLRRLRARLRTA